MSKNSILNNKFILFSVFLLFFAIHVFSQDFFWENPKVSVPSNAWFPVSASKGGFGYVMWQEYADYTGNAGTLWFSIMATGDGVSFTKYSRVIGPIPVTGDKIPMLSLSLDSSGSIYAAVSATGNGISIYKSIDRGKTFTLLGTAGGENGNIPTVAPKLFITSKGNFILFATRPLSVVDTTTGTSSGTLGITYSISSQGKIWSPFKPLVKSTGLSNIYLPYGISQGGTEYVVFQASPEESRFYQLYLTLSRDGGITWTLPVRITSEDEKGQSANNYDNQRPYLFADGSSIYISWERKLGVGTRGAYWGTIDPYGGKIVNAEQVEGADIDTNSVNNPQITFVKNHPAVLWFNSIGRVVMAYKPGEVWENVDIAGQQSGISSFARFVKINGEVDIVWQNSLSDKSQLVLLTPDKTVPSVTLYPDGFKEGAASRRDTYTITWNLPRDSSGIAGFSYAVDKNRNGTSAERVMIKRRDPRRASVTLTKDGTWYFHVRAVDYAGNWSSASSLSFTRDTTPPGEVTFVPVEVDENGFLKSNTGTLEWDPPSGEEAAGYSYHVQYLAPPNFKGDITRFKILPAPDVINSRKTFYHFNNKDNGIWAITVSTFDAVGNKSPGSVYYFKLDKYIPVTYITKVKASQDELGNINIDIYGRGFSVGGRISTIILDKDRRKPYDYVYTGDTASFKVVTDRIIKGLAIDNMEQGSYYVGLIHPSRGLYFNRTKLTFDSTGAVKFGNFSILDKISTGEKALRWLYTISINTITFLVVMVFLATILVAAGIKIVLIAREGRLLMQEAHALIYNEELPSEKKKEGLRKMKKRGMGLRIKFGLLITLLVLVIVLMVAYPLSIFMVKTQQKNLTESLNQTTKVLMNSIKASASKYLQENNTLELKRLPSQIESMPAARYITISGPGVDKKNGEINDFIWVSNDNGIADKIISKESEAFLPGGEKFVEGKILMKDSLSPEIEKMARDIDKKGRESVGKLAAELDRLQKVAAQATRNARTADDVANIRRMQDEISLVSKSIEGKLEEIGNIFGSIPPLNPDKILTAGSEYTFYAPIVYQARGNADSYFQGVVRLGISTDNIIKEIKLSRSILMKRTVFIALLAIGLGILGALILATIIIIPINHLLGKVKEISGTDDHSTLKNFKVSVRSKDEIFDLAEAVNQMAHGLYVAAEAKKELTVGKEIQKRFIPLEMGPDESKLSTGSKKSEYIDIFGYYEGAKGVSGDYFDFIEIEADKFAIIKCDIAGKGVSASLIMVEVATIFHNYFNEWKKEQQRRKVKSVKKKVPFKSREPDIAELVYSINSLVEEMGFKGRFAALIIALFDSKTGMTQFCNAGDNLVHIYRNKSSEMEILTLPEAPACGVFPNDMIEMSGGGFKNVPHRFEKGDILFLFTDGVEEAQRTFRDSNFNKIRCAEPGLKEGELHDTHPVGNETEELGIPRIQQIIKAVLTRGTYELYKYHNPLGEEKLVFDFSTCSGSTEEAVLAMVSVEKMFRIYPDPEAGEMDRISVDLKINEFLEKHFIQYKSYFRKIVESPKNSNYVVFSYLKEDGQYDDLTVLGIKLL